MRSCPDIGSQISSSGLGSSATGMLGGTCYRKCLDAEDWLHLRLRGGVLHQSLVRERQVVRSGQTSSPDVSIGTGTCDVALADFTIWLSLIAGSRA